jgi:SAM-dependent methyltransferase
MEVDNRTMWPSGRPANERHAITTVPVQMSSKPHASPDLGELGISEMLRQFVAEAPYVRRPILDFMMKVASAIAPGKLVLDVGAGDAPYRELFVHTHYLTNDWEESVHAGARGADIVGSAAAISAESSTFDLVLCTEVLEHVPAPDEVLRECSRILRPGGRLALTVPLAWQLHELPHDYYRYTAAGIEHLLTQAGLVEIEVRPRNDAFTTLAQLMLDVAWTMGSAPDGLDESREHARQTLHSLAKEVALLGPLDVRFNFPLGYTALARRP